MPTALAGAAPAPASAKPAAAATPLGALGAPSPAVAPAPPADELLDLSGADEPAIEGDPTLDEEEALTEHDVGFGELIADDLEAEPGAVTPEPSDTAGAAPAAPGAAGASTPAHEPAARGPGAPSAHARPSVPVNPLAGLGAVELERRLREEPRSLGTLSVGTPNGGALINGVQMPESSLWRLASPSQAYGTEETVAYIAAAVREVARQFPDHTAPLSIGDLSARRGGRLHPHLSHQAGRDVDLGFYYVGDQRWYTRATAETLDLPRTWALLRAFVTETDPEMIFLDRRVQALLKDYALSVGEDPAWLEDLFVGDPARGRRPLILHEPGHQTHLHIRFYSPEAQAAGAHAYPVLRKLGLVAAPVYFVEHKVKRGETLSHISRRYGLPVKTLMQANGMKKTTLRIGRSLRIPKHGSVRTVSAAALVPARRLPPGSVPALASPPSRESATRREPAPAARPASLAPAGDEG